MKQNGNVDGVPWLGNYRKQRVNLSLALFCLLTGTELEDFGE